MTLKEEESVIWSNPKVLLYTKSHRPNGSLQKRVLSAG